MHTSWVIFLTDEVDQVEDASNNNPNTVENYYVADVPEGLELQRSCQLLQERLGFCNFVDSSRLKSDFSKAFRPEGAFETIVDG